MSQSAHKTFFERLLLNLYHISKGNLFVGLVPFCLGGVSWRILLNGVLYFVGFEVVNQYNSKEEDELNGKSRPEIDPYVAGTLWGICFIFSEWPVKIWLLCTAAVYLSRSNSTPFKELVMCCGIFVHFYFLKISLDPIRIIRCAVMGSIQDYRDVKGDKAIGRVTLPMLMDFKVLYVLMTMFFCLISVVPWYATFTYIAIAVVCDHDPHLAYHLFQVLYVVEAGIDTWNFAKQ
jgi:4-hydroxybenzoate polyprenyltransferase